MYFSLFVGVLSFSLSLFCYAIIVKRKRKLVAFSNIVLQMHCYYKCSVALLHGAVGWSALCDCGTS